MFGGQFTVEWARTSSGSRTTFGPGEFWISDAGTSYMMTAGPEGVTYIEQWPGRSRSWRPAGTTAAGYPLKVS